MRRRDSASRWLKQCIEYEKRSAGLIVSEPGLLRKRYREKERTTDWSDPTIRAIAASKVLTLLQSDDALKKAFEVFGFDPRNPFDWRRLITHFAEANYGGKRRGAPKKWTIERMVQFISDVWQVKKRHPNAKITETCRLMKSDKLLEGKYKSVPLETLRKQYRNALKGVVSFRGDYRKRRRPISPNRSPGN
jgi:hypothetical protein